MRNTGRSWQVRAAAAERLAEGTATQRGAAALAALEMTLDAIVAPAFVVDVKGKVLYANTNGSTLLERDRHAIESSLARKIAGRDTSPRWKLAPLRGEGPSPGYLAILPSEIAPLSRSVAIAVLRWSLTARQREVLDLVARGLTNAVIAQSLRISAGTVEFHLSAIFDKAGVDRRSALIVGLSAL